MLLIHSGVGAGNEWDRVRPLLASEPLTPDLYGHGDAPVPDAPWSHADQMAALLDSPTTVAGASFGGGVALELATMAPEKVERLVLLAPALFDWEWSAEMRAFGAEEDRLIEAGDVDGATEANVRFWAAPGDEDIVRANQRRAFDLPLAAATEPHEREIDLAALTMPVTVLVGDRDLDDFQRIARHVAEATGGDLHVLEGAGHLLALERPDAVARALLATHP